MTKETEVAAWLADWDAGKPVWSVEMGRLGPGYEQAIQVLAVEMLRWLAEKKPVLPEMDESAHTELAETMDAHFHGRPAIAAIGYSSAQWGAARNIASCFWAQGPEKALQSAPVDRHIQVSRAWPSLAGEL